MSNTIVIGAQWGDEGKGKVVDLLSQDADLVVRFAGGANAGHTIWLGDIKHVLHLVPSGILNPACRNLIGGGCVIDPLALWAEVEELRRAGVAVEPNRLLIAEQAHLVTGFQRAIDRLTGAKIGTTGRGIGPAYADKARRIGLRMVDLRDGRLEEGLAAQAEFHGAQARALGAANQLPSLQQVLAELSAVAAQLGPFVADPLPQLLAARRSGSRVLYEGAQGVLLDIDQGTWPYVTSSNSTVAGATAGLGVYTPFDRRIAVVKAYSTRVGNGPFPTELHGEQAEALRQRGGEFGATTGRPRRCGWLDLVLLRRAFAMNDFTHVALTKLDVLAGFGPIRVAVAGPEDAREYREFPGFDQPLAGVKHRADLPAACRDFLDFLQAELGAPLLLVSTGASRDQALVEGARW